MVEIKIPLAPRGGVLIPLGFLKLRIPWDECSQQSTQPSPARGYPRQIKMSLQKLRKFYELKRIERANTVAGGKVRRKESPAEHSWSCLILADYFLSRMSDKMSGKASEQKPKLDRLKVYELLMYHDVVEIEAGDINLLNEQERKHKSEREKKAAHVLHQHLPAELGKKFLALFHEYEEGKSKEARFAKAIDALDAEIHELDYKEDWKGWTEEFLRKKKGPLFEEFPELKEAFEEIMSFVKKGGYFGR